MEMRDKSGHLMSGFAWHFHTFLCKFFEGGLKMLSSRVIRSNRHESFEWTEVWCHVLRTRKVHVSLFHGSWLPVGYAGWVENVVDSSRFDRIDTNCFPCCRFVTPEVDLRDATPCESSRDITYKSSRIIKCLKRIDSVWVYWTWMHNKM